MTGERVFLLIFARYPSKTIAQTKVLSIAWSIVRSIARKSKSKKSWLHHFPAPSHSAYWKSVSCVIWLGDALTKSEKSATPKRKHKTLPLMGATRHRALRQRLTNRHVISAELLCLVYEPLLWCPTRDASPPLEVAFCTCVLCLSLFAWLRFTEKQ